ncbi:single-stranded DNA-binding protein [Candidatus Saccharibacteria bacterium]|nr:single-stranded DNA-binding protein [Candidatus Saccharibacteria bacterium]
MRGFSKAIIAGNLTRDPELRSTPSGASVCGFSVAVNRSYKGNDGEQKDEVSFIDCSAWGRLGETIAQYGKKGTGVLVSGRLVQRSWDDKNGGGKRSRTEIVVEDFNFIGGGAGGNNGSSSYGGGSSYQSAPASAAAPADVPDDIPDGEIDLSDVPF